MNILVQRASADTRCAIRRHLLARPTGDRRLRFGATLGSEVIRDYVERIDFVISSPLLSSTYQRQLPGYDAYQNRLADAKDLADAVVLSAARMS